MTTVKRSQYPVRPSTAPVHRAAEPRRTALLAGGALLATVAAAGFAATGPGGALAHLVFHFLEFYCGVFSLVALSLTVMVGLAATDRVVLLVRHRVLAQGAHRALAMAALAFLALHVTTKIIEGHASLLDVLVPFLAGHRPLAVGLGTLASYLMIAVAVTGVVRGRFAGTSRVWLWRVLHAAAYVCWPVALLHGLNAGRPAKGWVTASYLLCVIAVALVLAVRGCVAYGQRLRGPRTQTTATMRPVGKISPVPQVATSIALGPDAAPPPRRPTAPAARRPARPAPPPAQARPQAPAQARPQAPAPVPAPASISDDEFWAFMRGGARQ